MLCEVAGIHVDKFVGYDCQNNLSEVFLRLAVVGLEASQNQPVGVELGYR